MKAAAINEQIATEHVLEKELQKSNDLIDQFIYSCSHGLRSPIKSMAGLVGLLRGCTSDNGIDREIYISLLTRSITRAKFIHKQFEEFASISTKPASIELIVLNTFMKQTVRSFTKSLRQAGISVSIHLEQKGEFYSQCNALHMILYQLLSNAVTFSDPNKVFKKISLFVTASPYSCSIQVHDNGIGIAQLNRDKIFNLFYRGSEKSQGAGIGLYIAKETAEKLGGTLSLQSSGSNGSIFSLWLPNQVKRGPLGLKLLAQQ